MGCELWRGTTGVGVDVAAIGLVAAGDNPERMKSEAAFAALCGVSPIEASPGKVVRHRLNRSGNRQANHALWRIAMVHLTCDPATRAYVERRRAEGKPDREIMRCLKRYTAREMFRHLSHPDLIPAESVHAPCTNELRRHPVALADKRGRWKGLRHPEVGTCEEWGLLGGHGQQALPVNPLETQSMKEHCVVVATPCG